MTERKRARVERCAGDVPVEPRNRGDEQAAVRHADASGGYIIENQHEGDRMRNIQVSRRGSEAASEEQSDNLKQKVRFEQEASNASASSDPYVALEYPASGEIQCRPVSVLVQESGRFDDDVQFSALDPFYEMDGRKSRYIKEVLDGYRGEDARNLKRSEGEIWKNDQKVVTDEELVQNIVTDEEFVKNIVTDEEFVKNIVTDEEFVKNFVRDDKNDSNVVMDLSMLKKMVDGTVCNPLITFFRGIS